MNQDFMKKKPPFTLVVSMSLPMVLSMLVNSLYNIIDSYFIAKISEDAMTALSLVFPIQNLVNAAAIGFGIGINAAVSYYLGAGDTKAANYSASQGLLLSGIHGLIFMIACPVLMPIFLGTYTNNTSIISFALRYSYIVFAFSIVINIGITFEKIFQSVGKMTVSMVSMLCGCIINIILDPLLIFGAGWIPSMGIEGAALATGIGQTVTLILYIVIYRIKSLPLYLQFKRISTGKKQWKRLYSVGIPAALNLALPSILISALNGILSHYSQMYVLILGIYYKLQTFIYLTANGIVQGIRPLVGYNYGAKEYKRVKQIHMTALSLCSIVMLVGMIICLFSSEILMGIFTATPKTIQAGANALQIISCGFVVSAVSVMTCGTLEGLGKGFSSLIISLIRYILIIPAAFLLSRMLGVTGVWHAFWVIELIACIISVHILHSIFTV